MFKRLCFAFFLLILSGSVFAQTRIEAEDWSAMSGVQIEVTSDVGGGSNVGWVDQGDWMDYSVNSATAGSHRIDLRIATGGPGGQIQIKNSSGTVLATVDVPFTYGYQNWQTITAYIPLSAGTQTIRLQSSASMGWNMNWFEVSSTVVSKIQAEDYTSMSGIQVVSSDGDGAGNCVAFIDFGDWMDYSFTAPHPGAYTVHMRVAAQNADAQLQIKKGSTTLVTVPVPHTGNYQVWTTATTTINITTAGVQTLRVQSSASPGWNFNWMEIVAPVPTTVNNPPVPHAGTDQTITLAAGATTAPTVQLTGSATDPDGNTLTYSWTKASGPSAGTITAPSAAATTVTGLVAGEYTFRLTVSDGTATQIDDVTVTVVPAATTGSGWSLAGNAIANPATEFLGSSNAQPLVMKTSGIERLRIGVDGKVSINTASGTVNTSSDPVLSVNGTVWARKLKVTQSTWADYVFEPEYKLMSLRELEAFIKANRHLPGVPSTAEVKKEGLDMGAVQETLLRKVEELTLYVIEQNRNVERLEAQVKRLQQKKSK